MASWSHEDPPCPVKMPDTERRVQTRATCTRILALRGTRVSGGYNDEERRLEAVLPHSRGGCGATLTAARGALPAAAHTRSGAHDSRGHDLWNRPPPSPSSAYTTTLILLLLRPVLYTFSPRAITPYRLANPNITNRVSSRSNHYRSCSKLLSNAP